MNAPRPVIPALTGLRFFAAFGVLVYHFENLGLVAFPGWLAPLAIAGRDGVGLFFVLSGYVLALRYADAFRRGFSQRNAYLRARFARIAPLYFLGLLLATPIALFLMPRRPADTPPMLVISWLVNATFLHAWVPFAPFDKWDTPSWSVSAEMFFYWLFPAFAYGALRHVRTRRAGLVLVAGLYLAGALLLVGLASLNPIFLAASRFLPLTRLWEFLIGAGLGYLRLRHGPSNRRRDGVLALLLVGLVVVAYLPRPGRVDEVAWYFGTAPLNAALIALLGNASGIWERLLAHRWLQELGDASYALYLLQQPAIYATFYLVGASSWRGWLAIPLTIALLAGSVAVHRGIEAPARRWLLATRPEERVAVRDPVHTPTAS